VELFAGGEAGPGFHAQANQAIEREEAHNQLHQSDYRPFATDAPGAAAMTCKLCGVLFLPIRAPTAAVTGSPPPFTSPCSASFVPGRKGDPMLTLCSILRPTCIVYAHCDIPCGIYDPEQARIEAESCYKIIGMYQASDDANFKARCIYEGGARRARQAPPRRPVARLLQARAPPGVPGPARDLLEGDQAGKRGQAVARLGRRQGAAVDDRHDRRDVEGDWRPREDAGQRPALLSAPDRAVYGRAVPAGWPRWRSALALGAVLLYRYVDVGSLGPLPDMYEDTWQVPGKLLSAYAEGAAVLLAGVGLLSHRRRPGLQRLIPMAPIRRKRG
jgi:hypothetical protein